MSYYTGNGKENKVWSALAFLSALMLARKLSAAAKSNVSSDIEELLG